MWMIRVFGFSFNILEIPRYVFKRIITSSYKMVFYHTFQHFINNYDIIRDYMIITIFEGLN